MERGMVSEKNIAFLRERKASYLVGTPKAQLRDFEKQLLEHDGKGEEQYVLCRSSARAEKERAMLARQSDRLTEELLKIDAALRRQPEADMEKLGRRIGRHQGKNPAAAKHIDVQVQRDAKSAAAIGLQISTPTAKGQRGDQHHGAYLLRTNCTETDPAKLWRWSILLAPFASGGSFGLRPACRQSISHLPPALGSHKPKLLSAPPSVISSCARSTIRKPNVLKPTSSCAFCPRPMARARAMDELQKSRQLRQEAGGRNHHHQKHGRDHPVKRGDTSAELTVRTVARAKRRVAELLTCLDLELPACNHILDRVPATIAANAAA